MKQQGGLGGLLDAQSANSDLYIEVNHKIKLDCTLEGWRRDQTLFLAIFFFPFQNLKRAKEFE
jgi:hypothetical protein